MSFQYTYDANGKPVGVFIPISEWEQLTKKIEGTKPVGGKNKATLLKSIAKGLREVEDIKQGKKKSIPIKQLLDEL